MLQPSIVGVCLLFASSVVLAADADPFAFRGATLGASERDFVQRLPYLRCRDGRNRIVGDRFCAVPRGQNAELRFGPVVARSITAYGYGDTVGKVTVNVPSCKGDDLAKLRNYLKSSLGSSPTTTTLRGASRERWTGASSFVELTSFPRGRCIVTYESTAYAKELDARASSTAATRPKEM